MQGLLGQIIQINQTHGGKKARNLSLKYFIKSHLETLKRNTEKENESDITALCTSPDMKNSGMLCETVQKTK